MTDCGLAQACGKTSDGEGRLAPTLETLLRTKGGLGARHAEWLNALAGGLYALNANVPDFLLKNIAVDEGGERLVLVDGYGDKTILPFRAWLAPLN